MFLIGIVWLAICARTHLETVDRADPSLPTERSRLPTTETKRRASEPETATPNIVVLCTGIARVNIGEIIGLEEPVDGSLRAATITSRNDVVPGRITGEMRRTNAHLTLNVNGGDTVHVDAGHWLGEQFNAAAFHPGATKTLVVAVVGGREDFGAVPDDRRFSSDTWFDLKLRRIEGSSGRLHVKLVGGWPEVTSLEYDFELALSPQLKLAETRPVLKRRSAHRAAAGESHHSALQPTRTGAT